jgi:glutamate synthase (NADPH/NADH) large chain
MELFNSVKENCGFGLLANIKNIPSHENLGNAIHALERMMHRGAIDADGKTGDGSGLLLSIPHKFMKKKALEENVALPEQYAIAMVFSKNMQGIDLIYSYCQENDLKVVFSRTVPVNTDALGEQAKQSLPDITQIFITPSSIMATKRFEALLYVTRKELEVVMQEDENFYIASFSNQTLSYKGLVMPTFIKEFYIDFLDTDFEISFALFHQRFSTNTLPQWRLAQPFRTIAHNGEINSVSSNRFNTLIKSEDLHSSVLTEDEMKRVLPIIRPATSDSGSLDNFFEFLLINGMDFFKAARALIPAPWQNAPHMDAKLRSYYEYTSTSFEAWDGPAAVSLTDGRYIGVVVDRNGLRPAKYTITKDDTLLISSEYGVIDIQEDNIKERGRLQSGQMIALDLKFGKVLKEKDINDYLKNSNPYMDWLNESMIYLQEHVDKPYCDVSDCNDSELVEKQRYFNITHEVIEQVIEPMINDVKEATGSMGDDTPLAAFSDKQRNFSDFFKQKFAQVTNPPIDPLRERVVMSLNTGFGEIHNILDENQNHAKRLKSISPIITKEKLDVLLSFGDEKHARYQSVYRTKTFSITIEKEDSLENALIALSNRVIRNVKEKNIRIVVLSDKDLNSQKAVIPMLMAIGRINQELLKANVRHLVSMIAVTGDVYDSHSAATLIAYGVNAIHPYLLFSTVYQKINSSKKYADLDCKEAYKSVHFAMNSGLLKIMSKMGIATIASYRNSALFDIIGLSRDIIDQCFTGSQHYLCGLTYADIEKRLYINHTKAYKDSEYTKMFPLNIGGYYKYVSGAEYHDYSPDVVHAIHEASQEGTIEAFDKLKNLINSRDKKFIRDFFVFKSDKKAISIDEVEEKDAIFKRFSSAAMSMGSISPEAHECIAEAMNTIGAKSNSGEGGEDKARFGTIKNSKIKQVASGRFGVTPAYLQSAQEIQIKVAQGAKPGEGGQLPGHKVTALIGKLRYTVPGVTLISPPPHHDIYSIEDLAQLIYDLKQANPKARVAVKLVSTAGVGTIATGVAKAYADKIIISGGDGGTGAAPLTSIKFAGNSWELGLSEAHNALKENNLRGLVEVETDGGLKTGLDVVKAAMLGAESYAFGTGVLTILGCKILRICHLNKCSVGIATQNEFLRDKHYIGTVERLINYFTLMAEDVRQILASLGYKSLEEIVGRSDLLEVIDDDLARKFDFSSVLKRIKGTDTVQQEFNEPYDDNAYEKELLKKVRAVIEKREDKIVIEQDIKNTNRSFGTMISGEVAKYYGDNGLPPDSIVLKMKGVAGQSLGAFLNYGVSIYIDGVANDYVGKGMHGGKIVVTPRAKITGQSAAGNTLLYGATGGKLFVAGEVGERFAVRNSGAMAVVEGTGDHACEYMTGGVVVILGETGLNFGAGMTGGAAFIYDIEHNFIENINQELIEAIRIDTDTGDEARHYLKKLLKAYLLETKSNRAEEILNNFRVEIRNFWLVQPKQMKKLPLNPDEGV